MRADSIRVFVDNLAAARGFYADGLGIDLLVDGLAHGYLVFDAGSGLRLIIEHQDPSDPEDGDLVGRFVGLSLRVSDVGAEVERLRALGHGIEAEPARQEWGAVLAHVRDSAGNVLSLVQYGAPPSPARRRR